MPGGNKMVIHTYTKLQVLAAGLLTFCFHQVIQFQANVPLMEKPGVWFLLTKCMKNTCLRVTLYVKMQVDEFHVYLKCHFFTAVFYTFC